MKNFMAAFAACILLFGCTKYDNTIQGRTTEQQGHWVYDSVTNSTHLQEDSMYIVAPTWRQSFEYEKKFGDLWIFWVFMIAGPVLGGFLIYSADKWGKGITVGHSIAAFVIWAVFVIIAVLTVEYSKWNRNQYIPKSQYEQLMQRDGNLKSFWETIE